MNNPYVHLKELNLSELLRIFRNDSKELLHLSISVFNAGAVVRPTMTNDHSKPCDNGYDYYLYNDDTLKSEIKSIITIKMNEVSLSWGKFCYHYTFSNFLKTYRLSENKYKDLLRLVK